MSFNTTKSTGIEMHSFERVLSCLLWTCDSQIKKLAIGIGIEFQGYRYSYSLKLLRKALYSNLIERIYNLELVAFYGQSSKPISFQIKNMSLEEQLTGVILRHGKVGRKRPMQALPTQYAASPLSSKLVWVEV